MIDKLTLAVGEMDSMVAFYSGVLGTRFTATEMYEHTLYVGRFGELDIMLCPKSLAGVDANINTVQVRFIIAGVTSAFEKGVELGGIVITAPAQVDGRVHASLRDPDGNSLEIIEPVPSN